MGLTGLLALAAPLAAQQVDLGGGSELFTLSQRPAGARALALGGAFEALADDASGAQWNPAAPAMSRSLGLGLHHETWLDRTDREVLSAQVPVGGTLGVGVYGSWVNYGSTQLRDASGTYLGDFSAQEQNVGLALSGCWSGLALGVAGRYLRMGLPGADLQAAAGDLGLLWQAAPRLRLAGVVKALPLAGGSYRASGTAGLALQSLPGQWHWALSSSVRLDPAAASEVDAGLEAAAGPSLPLMIRLGYAQAMPDLVQDLGSRFSGGLGVSLGRYQLDYAYLPWGSFGATHRISLSLLEPWAKAAAPAPVPAAPPPAPAPLRPAVPLPDAAIPAPAPQPAARETRFNVLSDAVVQARALEAAGRLNDALRLYHQAAQDPSDLGAWKGMAQLYQRAGKADYARQCWQQVLRLDPQDPAAVQALAPAP
jgi:tetratricopeptide (TPR) repeat protein